MYDKKTQKQLYAMARLVSDRVPEIKDGETCRNVLAAAGFPAWAVKQHLRMVQRMARIIRGRDADRLVKQQLDDE